MCVCSVCCTVCVRVALSVCVCLRLIAYAHKGSLVIFMAAGQCMLAFGVLMSSFGSLHDFHCNPETRWRNTCRSQGFFVLAGLHVTITTCDF